MAERTTLARVQVLIVSDADRFSATVTNAAMIIVIKTGRAIGIIVALVTIQAVRIAGPGTVRQVRSVTGIGTGIIRVVLKCRSVI